MFKERRLKTLLSYLTVALLGFGVGYLTHPLINTSNDLTTKTLSNKPQRKYEQPSSQLRAQTKSNNSTAVVAKSKAGDSLIKANVEKTTSSATANEDPIAIIQIIPENTAAQSITPEQTAELRAWANNHKAELNELINTHLPNHIAQNMIDMIGQNNAFLTQPAVKQDPAIDANWAVSTEEELRSYIENHPESSHFDLISVSCKQLKCDVLGIEKEAQAWIKIFFSMFKNLPNVNPPDSSGDTNSFSFLNGDDTTSVYYQLKFKPS